MTGGSLLKLAQIKKTMDSGKLKRWLLNFFLWFMLFIIVSVIALILLAYLYEDKVKAYAINELNKSLAAEVKLNPTDIHFSFISHFPDASLEFRNVTIMDATNAKKKGVMCEANRISLLFNLVNIFYKNYTINSLRLEKPIFNLWIDENGNDNFHLWIPPNDSISGDPSPFLRLSDIMSENMSIRYCNKIQKQDYLFSVPIARLKGLFNDEQYNLAANAELKIEHFISDSVNYLAGRKCMIDAELKVNNDSGTYTFSNGIAKLEGMNFLVNGFYRSASDYEGIDLNIKGKDLDIVSFLSLVPEKYKNTISGYESSGNFYFDAFVKGRLSKHDSPSVQAKFGIKKGTVIEKISGIAINNIKLEGNYNNGKTRSAESSSLHVSSFSGNIGNNPLKASFTVTDFSYPQLDLAAEGKFDLSSLLKLFPVDTIENIEGNAVMDITFSGRASDFGKFNASDLKSSSAKGKISLTNTRLKVKGMKHELKDVNGSFEFRDNDLFVEQLDLKIFSSDFSLQGNFFNFLAWAFLDDQPLVVEAAMRSGNVLLDELLSDESSKSNSDYKLAFPQRIRLDLNSRIDKLKFRRFESKEMTGTIKIFDNKLLASNVSFKAMDGTAGFEGLMINASDPTNINISCDAKVEKIDISKLFYQFENFGQEYVRDSHLKGIITANIQFSSTWNDRLETDPDKVYALCDILIEKGELNGFEPMSNLSDYIRMEELQNIKFSTLKNKIEIKNKTINIPMMDIQSSAISISAYGKHTFDNGIDYHIKLSLNELMAKKAKRSRKENNEFGVVEDDKQGRMNLFISMTGTVDNPIIKYDRKNTMQIIKEDIKAEKKVLKEILNEEFGWFKGDSLKAAKKELKKEEEKNNDKFRVEWQPAGEKTGKTKNKEKEKEKEIEEDEDF